MRGYFEISGCVANLNFSSSDSEEINDRMELFVHKYSFNLLFGANSPNKTFGIDYVKTTLLQLNIQRMDILKLYGF